MKTKFKAYVGTYTNGESKGIYSFILDTSSQKLDNIRLEAELGNPTYLTITSDNKYLYSVVKSGVAGGVSAYKIGDEKLCLLNSQLSEGSSPCHVSLTRTNDYLFSANYHKGEVAAYPLDKGGTVAEICSLFIHGGSGPNKARQEKAHAHYAALAPDEKYLCVIDLGIDKLVVYSFNSNKLEKHKEISFKPGCGPRHMAFHPNGKFAYVLTELSAEVAVLNYSKTDGTFEILEYISSLPTNFMGENTGSAIHVSQDGNYLYTSNRGHDSIAVFKISQETGKLEVVQHISTEGSGPRDFALTPDGNFLIAANQNSSNLVPFSIDKSTGKLSRVGDIVSLPNPVCIKFISL
ncbi:lactonase family protein [Clostridium swellfunianum]|uniref:lactonase family protein n=1 Tax=Clostridium swellfunianum TaxID=1367462 RepID=UPI00202FE7A0|nr:lactonase family protein [Clostridium swellfunianum]MCM0646881.1 lactonase family protein [Clostridium swellfunianum]